MKAFVEDEARPAIRPPIARSIAILGLGNLLRSDDGVGIHAVRRLQEDARLRRHVQLIDGGTLGLDLLPAVTGITHLLVLDAVDRGSDPGTILRFSGADLEKLPVAKSVHLLGFSDLLGSLTLLGHTPTDVVLLGIQPESTDWGVLLSPAVDAALNQLLEAVFAQLSSWG